MKVFISFFLPVFILCIFSLPSIFSLLHHGFFQTDDGEWMIIRFSAFHQTLVSGQFPVRFLSRLNYGFGYPVADFLYPGFMYLSEPIHFLHIGFVDTIKIMLGMSLVGSALFCYLWLSKLFSKTAAFFGALFYLYNPYHLYDIYTRGSVGEILALAILPFIFWQIERRNFFWVSIGLGLLILSHNILAVLFFPLIVIYLFLVTGKRLMRSFCLLTILCGIGLAAFFWIPALYDLQYTVFSKIQVSDWRQYFAQGDLFHINIVTLTFSLVVLFLKKYIYAPFFSSITQQQKKLYILFFLYGFICLCFATTVSILLWYILPLSFVQFPFRYLSGVIPAIAFLTAFVLGSIKKQYAIILGISLFVVLCISSVPYSIPKIFFDKGEGFYATNEDTTTVKNEYMPKWVTQTASSHAYTIIDLLPVTIIKNTPETISFITTFAKMTSLTVNKVYFPGWKITIDTHPVVVATDTMGRMKVSIPKGYHIISATFVETPLRLFADSVSLVSIVGICFFTYKMKDIKK